MHLTSVFDFVAYHFHDYIESFCKKMTRIIQRKHRRYYFMIFILFIFFMPIKLLFKSGNKYL